MASTGSTIVNRFTSESDDFDVMIALLSSISFQCHWFANRQCSFIHFPLHTAMLWELCMIIPTPHPVLLLTNDSLGSCVYCFAALQAMVSWADTFDGHSLTSVRSDRGGNYLLDDNDFGVAHHSSVLPSISVAWCRSPASHLFPSSTSTTIVWRGSPELYLLIIFFIGLRPSPMTPT